MLSGSGESGRIPGGFRVANGAFRPSRNANRWAPDPVHKRVDIGTAGILLRAHHHSRATCLMPLVAPELQLAGSVPTIQETAAVYRPIEEHINEFVLAHENRFAAEDGPQRAVVGKEVDSFLACGRR